MIIKIRKIILYIGPLPAFLYKYEPAEAFETYFGNSLRLFIKDIKVKKFIEYILAILLVLTAFVILLK